MGSKTSSVTNVTITMLEKYEQYTIVVFATSDKGLGDPSDPLMVLTDEDGELLSLFINSLSFIVSLCEVLSNLYVVTCACMCVLPVNTVDLVKLLL